MDDLDTVEALLREGVNGKTLTRLADSISEARTELFGQRDDTPAAIPVKPSIDSEVSKIEEKSKKRAK